MQNSSALKHKHQTANVLLSEWLSANSISISQCSRDLGYKSNYIMHILAHTNPRPITYDVIGRLLFHYGSNGPALEMARALKAQRNGNGHKA